MPCLLPLALLMGHAVTELLAHARGRTIRINGCLNVVIATGALLALLYLQATREIYANTEMFSLSMVYIVLVGWIIANALQILRPLELWAMPALGIWLLVALLPAAMPSQIVDSKMPTGLSPSTWTSLKQTTSLLSNDLGAALGAVLAGQTTAGRSLQCHRRVEYGLEDPAMASRKVTKENVGQWMTEARKKGSVGVVMRVNSVDEIQEVELLPIDGQRFQRGNLEVLIFPANQALTAIDVKNRDPRRVLGFFASGVHWFSGPGQRCASPLRRSPRLSRYRPSLKRKMTGINDFF